jgi:hypothetical protein
MPRFHIGPLVLVALLGAACGSPTETGTPTTPTTGTLNLVITAADSDYAAGETVMYAVDGGTLQVAIMPRFSRAFTLSRGRHSIRIHRILVGCTVAGGEERTVEVGDTVTLSTSVDCRDRFGTLSIVTATTGTNPDPDGYTFEVSRAPTIVAQATGRTAEIKVEAGTHDTPAPGGMNGNCATESP